MKQQSNVRKPATVPASQADETSARSLAVINEADLDKVSGGGGAAGGIVMRGGN